MKMNLLFSLLVSLGLALPAFADERPADIADAWFVVVKDGHDDEFNAALKEHLKYRAKKGDTRVWKTYAPVIGDDLNHYVIRHCCSTFAAMDDYREWTQKTKMNDNWNEFVDPHVAQYRHYYDRIDMKNSNWPDKDPGFQLFGVTSWKTKPGHGAAIESSKSAMSDAAKAGGWPRVWSWSNTMGGEGGLVLVSAYLNYADMEGPAGGFSAFLAKQIGEQAATEMLGDFSDNFYGSTYTVYRKVDDLSMSD